MVQVALRFGVVVALLAAWACGSGNNDDRGAGAGPAFTNGPIILIDDEGAVFAFDADGGDRRLIEAPPADGRGETILAPGIAFLETDEDEDQVLLVDADEGVAKVLGQGSAFNPLGHGGGKRFALLTGDFETDGLLVDVAGRAGRPMADFLGGIDDGLGLGPSGRSGIDPTEQLMAIEDVDEVHVVALGSDIGEVDVTTSVTGSFVGFTDTGQAVVSDFVSEPEENPVRSELVFVSKDGEEHTLDDVEGYPITVIGGSALMVVDTSGGDDDGEVDLSFALVDRDGERQEIDFGQRKGQEVKLFPGEPGGRTAFVVKNSQAKKTRGSWGVVQADGKVERLADLEKLEAVYAPERRYVALTDIKALSESDGKVKGTVAVIDIEAGRVHRAGFDPGRREVRPGLSVAPDGNQVAIHGVEDEEPITWIVPLDDGGKPEVVAASLRWSPDGERFLGVRYRGDEAIWFVRLGIEGEDVDLGPGANVVWTPG